jgi:16S rRNA (cytosine967-C5)-methyltransferase
MPCDVTLTALQKDEKRMISQAEFAALADAGSHVLRLTSPADRALSTFFHQHPNLGGRDRARIAEAIFALLRNLRLMETLVPKPTPRLKLLASLHLLQGIPIAKLAPPLPEGDRAWLNEAAQRYAQLDKFAAPVRVSMPDWLYDRMRAQYGDEGAFNLGLAQLTPAPLDLRVNTFKAKRDDVLKQLQDEGLPAEATPFSPCGIRINARPSLAKHALFIAGAFEVQDEGSQLVVHLLEPKRGEMVVDFCAGAGGKTLAVAAEMRSTGRVYAWDINEKRLANLAPRLKRSGVSNVHPEKLASDNDPRVKRLAGRIDRVIIDAPCTGVGTLRRNPDLKWRQHTGVLAEVITKQMSILRSASRLPRVGGRLVYATCSLLAEENDKIIDAFLSEHPNYKLVSANEILSKRGIDIPGLGATLKLRPDVHNTDGFFAAALERIS